MITKKLSLLPDEPGIYLFYHDKELIYVGKATSLKSRVKSYFQGQKSPRPIEEMIFLVNDIKWIETDSVLEAIILEANYIKKFQPKYNVLGKDDKSWNYIVITNEKIPRVLTRREHELKTSETSKTSTQQDKFKYTFGPYPNLKTKETMKILQRLFRFCTCNGKHKTCLYQQMEQCLGVNLGKVSIAEYKRKSIKPLIMFLQGNKKSVLRNFEKQMQLAAKNQNFEEAAIIRNQLGNLQRIQDVVLLNEDFVCDANLRMTCESTNGETNAHCSLFTVHSTHLRIEGYDISNLGESDKVGSMVVFDAHGPIKSDYKKFKIRTVAGQSDVDCLAEVLGRRLKHGEWTMPDVFLVDGGLPQLNRAKKIIDDRNLKTPIVGIAKGPDRKKNEFFVAHSTTEFKAWFEQNKNLLIRVRDEAHRFAIAYQRQTRKLK